MLLQIRHLSFMCCASLLSVAGLVGCSTLSGSASESGGNGGAERSRLPEEQVISQPRADSRNSDGAARRNPERTNGRSSQDTSSLYDSSAEAILEGSKFRRKIELDNIDQELLAAAVFHETNRMRQQEGLQPLAHLSALDDAAMLHARSMARERYLSHENRDSRLRQPIDRVRAVGLKPRFVAENIATAFGIRYESGERVYVEEGAEGKVFSREPPPNGEPIRNHTYRSFARELVEGWMNSPGHRQNILQTSGASGGGGPTHMGHACVHSADDEGIPTLYCVQLFYAGR